MRWFLVLALLWGEAWAQEPPAWFADSLLFVREDAAEAAKEGKRVMLYFGQDGCPYCKQLMEVNFRQARIVEKMQKGFVALAINIWGDREVTWSDGRAMSEKQLAAALKVQFTPTLLFLDEKGGIALRVNGYLPPERFEAALDYVAAKMERKLAFSDYKKIPEKANENLNPQSFFMKPPYDLRRKPGSKPLAVLFETPHCAGCDELHREGFKRKEVLSRLAKFDVVRFSTLDNQSVVAPGGQQIKASEWAIQLEAHVRPVNGVLRRARTRDIPHRGLPTAVPPRRVARVRGERRVPHRAVLPAFPADRSRAATRPRRNRRSLELGQASNFLSTWPGPRCRSTYFSPSKTCSPFTHTPCTPRGRRIMRVPPPGRSACFSSGEMPTLAGSNSSRSAHCPAAMRAAPRNAVLARRIAGQAAHALLQRERARLAHPMGEQVQPEAGVAEVDEVRAGVRQRHHARPGA